MEFKSVRSKKLSILASPVGGTSSVGEVGGDAPPPDGRGKLLESAQNLLKHIPGEASGFYLMAMDAFPDTPDLGIVGFIFVLALILLVVVRRLAGASNAIMFTTVGAFFLWMLVLKQGFFAQAFPTLLPEPLGLILAVFYSALITALAGSGKIK